MTLPQTVLFPNALLPLYIFEPRYRRMLSDVLTSHRMFAVAMQRPDRNRETPCPVAGLGLVRAAVTQPDGTTNLVLQGLARVELGSAIRYRPYRLHPVRQPPSARANPSSIAPLTTHLRGLISRRLEQGIALPPPILKKLEQIAANHGTIVPPSPPAESPPKDSGHGLIADLISCTLLSSATRRQVLLETWDVEARFRQLICFLMEEIEQRNQGNA